MCYMRYPALGAHNDTEEKISPAFLCAFSPPISERSAILAPGVISGRE